MNDRAEPKSDGSGGVLEARFSPKFFGFFAWYTRRLFGKKFSATLIERGSRAVLEHAAQHDGPVLIYANHPGWWDPLVAVLLTNELMNGRPMLAAMDRSELQRFNFMRRLGLFGIDPDDAASLQPMVGYLARSFQTEPRQTFWVTPQGHFKDVRDDLKLRPGAATTAARLSERWPPHEPHGLRVVALAIEYTFWNEREPMCLLRAREIEPPNDARSTTAWQRAMTASLRDGMERLAELAIARDPAPFEPIVGGDATKVNPVYDVWLRLRGKSGGLGERREGR
jgi:1-acyl-sn-glycerol-3-phosphate acyltransferase